MQDALPSLRDIANGECHTAIALRKGDGAVAEQDVDLRSAGGAVDDAQGGIGFGRLILSQDWARRQWQEAHDEGEGDEHHPKNPRNAT